MSDTAPSDALAAQGTAEPQSLQLAREFADMAKVLFAEPQLEATLARICALGVAHIPNCHHAAVSLVEGRGRIRSHGATDEVPIKVDDLQYRTGQGPCLEAIGEQDVLVVDDLAEDDRWPEFAPLAVAAGVRSMLSFRLFAAEETIGALNLYSRQPGALGGDDMAVQWGAVFAAHASVAVAGARTELNLRTALESRETISVAVGMLMARQQVSREEAFDILRRASQRMNVKLRDVAQQLAGGSATKPSLAFPDEVSER